MSDLLLSFISTMTDAEKAAFTAYLNRPTDTVTRPYYAIYEAILKHEISNAVALKKHFASTNLANNFESQKSKLYQEIVDFLVFHQRNQQQLHPFYGLLRAIYQGTKNNKQAALEEVQQLKTHEKHQSNLTVQLVSNCVEAHNRVNPKFLAYDSSKTSLALARERQRLSELLKEESDALVFNSEAVELLSSDSADPNITLSAKALLANSPFLKPDYTFKTPNSIPYVILGLNYLCRITKDFDLNLQKIEPIRKQYENDHSEQGKEIQLCIFENLIDISIAKGELDKVHEYLNLFKTKVDLLDHYTEEEDYQSTYFYALLKYAVVNKEYKIGLDISDAAETYLS